MLIDLEIDFLTHLEGVVDKVSHKINFGEICGKYKLLKISLFC